MRPEPGYLELMLALCSVRWRLRRRGFHALAGAALEAPATVAWPPAAVAMRRLRRLSRFIGGSCLQRSLSLLQSAARRGVQGQLVLGAQREGERLYAHAWVRFGADCHGDTQRGGRDYEPFPPPAHPVADPVEAPARPASSTG